MSDPLALPFDQYQRYRLVADLVERLREGRGALDVLDVGGRTAVLRGFLPDDRVRLVDVEPSDAAGLVLGDGSALPFQDRAFDVVAAFDTLEHVPPVLREAFVDECARVCRGHVLLAGPYRTPAVDEAEELLRSFLDAKLGVRHRYLEEHRAHGLPERAAVEARLSAAGARVTSVGHGSIARWLVLMCMEMYLDEDPKLRPLAERFFRFYNGTLYASDHAEPVYRHVVVGALGGRPALATEGLFEAPVAVPEAVERMARFGAELLAFDRERDVWRPEIERLEAVIAGLVRDLEGHRARLAETAGDLDEHRATLAALRADAERELSEHARERETLEVDLDEHARTVEALRSALERTQAEAAATRAELEAELGRREEVAETLTTDLEGHRATLAATRAEYERLQADAREIEAAREAAAAELDRARARLRDRWDSFKRAFGPRKSD